MSAETQQRPGGLAAVHLEQAREAAASGVDPWDVAAQLESRGISNRVAVAAGYPSVFALSRKLLDSVPAAARVRRKLTTDQRPWPLIWGALMRALVTVAGVIICVSTMPLGSTDARVFAIAATGWLAGQAVSSAIWHAWGRGNSTDGVRAGLAVGVLALALGVPLSMLVGSWTMLIWVGWAVAAPLLLVLRPGIVLAAVTSAVAVYCIAPRIAIRGRSWSVLPDDGRSLFAASVFTGAAVLVAVALTAWAMRKNRSRWHRGTPLAIGVALLQTAAQLTMLVIMFATVGPAGFGAIAVAGLGVGVAADPLFAVGRIWTQSVIHRSTSWWSGRLAIGFAGVVVAALMVWVGAECAAAVLSDPYQIFLNEPTVIAASVLASAVIVATNVLLRTGSARGAMLFALLVAGLTNLVVSIPADAQMLFWAMAGAAAVASLVAAVLTATRLANPRSW